LTWAQAYESRPQTSPDIATVYDFDTQDGQDFLVMEYIPGVTLNDNSC
jgi:hypothetical protein